jgi:hypothetical protein
VTRKPPNKTTIRKRTDAAFSRYIRERDGECKVRTWFPQIECNGNLQAAHVVSRRYRAIRWDPANCVAACAAHHLYGTHHPIEWENAVERAGIDLRNLRYLAVTTPPMDPYECRELWI